MNTDLGLHDERGDDIHLYTLNNHIGDDYAEYHAETATLREGHQASQRGAGDIAYEGDDLEDAAKDGKEDGVVDADKRKPDAVHDPEAENDDGQTPKILLHDLGRLSNDNLRLSFGFKCGGIQD